MRRLVVEEPTPVAAASRLVAVFALYVVIIAAVLLRFGLVDFWPAVSALASGWLLAVAAILLALVAFVRIWRWAGPGGGKAFAGFAIASLLLLPPVVYGGRALVSPRVNDVTTDFVRPPDFTAARGERRPGANLLTYDPAMAAAQQQNYPKIYPLVIESPPDEVHKLVLELVRERQWRITANLPLTMPDTEARAPVRRPVGRIEAVAKSMLLGLEDDIAIRISDQDGRTRVDMRSASRYGSMDFGANAERVSNFLEELRTRSLIPAQVAQ
jgi:uncharacterized protein (DUF1499 family)